MASGVSIGCRFLLEKGFVKRNIPVFGNFRPFSAEISHIFEISFKYLDDA